MATMRKAEISRAFGGAAGRYERHARVQQQVAEQLATLANQHWSAARTPPARILEIGCGTGLLTRQIAARWPDADLMATDISPTMIEIAEHANIPATFRTMDGELPDFEPGSFDLILSSLTFQWFDMLPRALERLFALLRSDGQMHFATMGNRSFAGWRSAHAACGQSCGMPKHPDLNTLCAMMNDITHAQGSQVQIPLDQTGGHALARHFHAIGAHAPRADHQPLSPTRLRQVIAHFDAAGGSADYHILFGHMFRKGVLKSPET